MLSKNSSQLNSTGNRGF